MVSRNSFCSHVSQSIGHERIDRLSSRPDCSGARNNYPKVRAAAEGMEINLWLSFLND
jgi:hypothetical protein